MKIYAMRFADDYIPGDEVTHGALFEQAEYYASIGIVRIERDEPAGVDSEPLEEKTVAELRELAKAADVDGYYDLRKAELVEALNGIRDNG